MKKEGIDITDVSRVIEEAAKRKMKEPGEWRRVAQCFGCIDRKNAIRENIDEDDMGAYSDIPKYAKPLVYAPFFLSDQCCKQMKKNPMHDFQKQTGRNPMTATMAAESRLREKAWLLHGCNLFDGRHPISNPMSFWTENDVLTYIKENNIKIAAPYKDVVVNYDGTDNVDGQLNFADVFGIQQNCKYKTTGCSRTGCIFCGYGTQFDIGRFTLIDKVSNPKLRDFCMRGGAFNEDGKWMPDGRGLGMWFGIQYINVHCGFKTIIPEYERYEKEYGNELTKTYLEK